eukprot:3765121-Rhodomonas_salina.1
MLLTSAGNSTIRQVTCAICLLISYAMSGTKINLRQSTETGHGGTAYYGTVVLLPSMVLRRRMALPLAMRCPVLRYARALPGPSLLV